MALTVSGCTKRETERSQPAQSLTARWFETHRIRCDLLATDAESPQPRRRLRAPIVNALFSFIGTVEDLPS